MTIQQSARIPVRTEPLDQAIERLRKSVAEMEFRYECTSEVMAARVASGEVYDTFEIVTWLFDYRTLQDLLEAQAEGIPTATTTTS